MTKRFFLALSFIALLYFIIQPIRANAIACNWGTQFTAYPSNSALMTPALRKKFEFQFKYSPLPNVKNIHLAYMHSDLAWKKAQEMLNATVNGKINKQFLIENALPEFQKILLSKRGSWILSEVRKTILSHGANAAELSLKNQGKHSDYLIIREPHQDNHVYIDIIHYLPAYSDKKWTVIEITLRANFPYKEWLLGGIHMYTTYRASF